MVSRSRHAADQERAFQVILGKNRSNPNCVAHSGPSTSRCSRLCAVASTTAATALACCSFARTLTSCLMGSAHDGSTRSVSLDLDEKRS